MIGEPPVDDAVKVIVALPLPPTAATFIGALGTVAGVTALLVPEGVLVPAAFVAVTLNVYVVPLLKPVIVIGDDVLVALNPPNI